MSDRDAHEAEGEGGFDTELARFVLHLRSRGLTEPSLLNAFERTPRALFLPETPSHLLYSNLHLPLPCGEEAIDPATLARHLVLLKLQPGLRVLEIGTGSGFMAGLLARLGCSVVSLERYLTLVRGAERALSRLGLHHVELHQADGLARVDHLGGFDRLILNGTVDALPNHVFERLKDGGLALGARKRSGTCHLMTWHKSAGRVIEPHDHGISRLPPLRDGIPAVL
ncbi:MAG: methyltransferase domain-containing protein [Proteobacteria bacterium]|nr:methyltransferase domain-containing protein [Pseudomonadota bacterium]